VRMPRSMSALLVLFVSLHAFADPPVVTSVEPNVGFTYGSTRATIRGSNFYDGELLNCPVFPASGTGVGTCPAQVFVGGIQAHVFNITPTTINVAIHASNTAIPRENGREDVRVVIEGKGEATLANGFEFHSDATPGRENYTTYLVPFTSEQTRGANGSIWTSELTVFNAGRVPLKMLGATFADPRFLSPPLEHAVTLPLRATRVVTLHRATDTPGAGAFIHVPNPLVGAVKMSLRVRDISQSASSWGTDVPVLTFDDMKAGVTLIDIPTDPRYRATLRIYHWSVGGGLPARVEIYAGDQPEPVESFETVSQPGAAGNPDHLDPDFLSHPSYVQVDLLTPKVRAAGSTIRVEIDNLSANVSPPLPSIWAMVSITNNETQQVTVVTPK
jgi:IPT/TIG domain